MSRSSSVSTKDRSQSKKPKTTKQRRDDSESFDVRSQYTPFYSQPQMPTWTSTPQYSPVGPQPFNGPVQNTYQHPMPAQFGPPTQQFNPGQMNNGNMQAYNNMPQVSSLVIRTSNSKADKRLAICSTKSTSIPIPQCPNHSIWIPCSIPVGSSTTTVAAAAAATDVSTSIPSSWPHGQWTSKLHSLSFRAAAEHCEPCGPQEPTPYPRKL